MMGSIHARSASSTPPLSSMVKTPSRPGSAPPPATGAQLSSPMYPTSQKFGIHSSPSTPSGPVPTSSITGGQQGQGHNYMSGPLMQAVDPHGLQNMQPQTGGALTQNINVISNSRSSPNQSVRPSPWQASVSGTASPLSNPSGLAGPPLRMTGPPTSMTGPPSNITGPPTRMTGPPTRMTGPPTRMTGPPTSMTGPPNSMTGHLTGAPTTLTQPQLRPPPTTPTGQMMGSTGQPLMQPMPQSPSTGPATPSSQPGSKRRVYPNPV